MSKAITYKQKVLKHYPNAICCKSLVSFGTFYTIYTPYNVLSESCNSAFQAWKNAWEKIKKEKRDD